MVDRFDKDGVAPVQRGDRHRLTGKWVDLFGQNSAGQSVLAHPCQQLPRGPDPKLAHRQASVINFVASEMAAEATDRYVQAFWERGPMGENSVDRIWDGVTEIQKLFAVLQLVKRSRRSPLGDNA